MALMKGVWAPSLSPAAAELCFGAFDITINVSAVVSYNMTSFVHHLLLQKTNGTLLLLIWHEISAQDVSHWPWRDVAAPPLRVTVVNIPPNYLVHLYAPNDGPGLSSTYSADNQSIFTGQEFVSLLIPPHVIVIIMDPMEPSSSPGSVLSAHSQLLFQQLSEWMADSF